MRIKKFKILLCIPIACFFVWVLHWQPWNPCASLWDQLEQCIIDYDVCQTDCSYCAQGSLTGVTDCASICNNPSCAPNSCDQKRENYNNCIADPAWWNASWSNASWSNASWSNASWSNASWSNASWSNASWSNASWWDETLTETSELNEQEDLDCEWEDDCSLWEESWEDERRNNPELLDWHGRCSNSNDISLNTENVNYINILEDGSCCFDRWWFTPSCPCVEPESGCGDDKTRSDEKCKCVCNPEVKCCGIQLNTVVPFIWDCIEMNADTSREDTTSVNSVTAFPILVQWLMKILMSAIMVFSFLMVIVAWLSMITWAFLGWNFKHWIDILKNVIISLILLWCSWLILSLINPSFFGG